MDGFTCRGMYISMDMILFGILIGYCKYSNTKILMSAWLIREDVNKLVQIPLGHLCVPVVKDSLLLMTICSAMVNLFTFIVIHNMTIAK